MDDKLHLNWDDVYRQSLKLAELVHQSGQKFDYLVVVPRGGYFVANIVARKLGFTPVNLLHACINSYDVGENNRLAEPEVGEMPTADEVKGKRLLIIDEVCETGDTLVFLTDYLQKAGAEKVSSGVLHYKPTKSQTGYKPDYFVEQVDKWIVYPWEEKEYTP